MIDYNPTFSICIPNYNYAHYLGETIRSVLNQTYPHFEIIVVDNASTDESVKVVRSFDDPRIRLFINQYNVGFAPNLDLAAQKASREFIIVLSSDDLMKPEALEMYAVLIRRMGENSKNALLVSAVDIIDSTGKVTGELKREDYYRIPADAAFTRLLDMRDTEAFPGLKVFREVYPRMSVPGHFCSTAFSRNLYDRVGGYASTNLIGPDAHFAYKALLQDATVVFHNKALFSYRVHGSNQLGQNKRMATIRLPIDRYLFSIQYTDAELQRAGVERKEMACFLVDDTCMKGAFHELRAGYWLQAFRYLIFAFASYPGLALRNPKTYAIIALLCLGGLAPYLSNFVYKNLKHNLEK